MPAGTFLPPGLTTSDVKISTGGTNNYVLTAVDSETIQGEANLTFDGSTLTVTGAVVVGSDGSGHDVTFYSDTGGDHLVWDSSAEKLTITGTNAATALDVADGNVSITDDLAVDGTSNLDNTDIDGTLAVDGTTISLDATTSLNIDNSNTSNGITIATATSGVPISIGHATSETTVNDNLNVTGTSVLATVDIGAGAIDATAIGASSTSTIKGTTIDATTDFTIGDTIVTDGVITDTSGLSIAAATRINLDDGSIATPSSETALTLVNASAAGDGVQLALISGTTGFGQLLFGDVDDENRGRIFYDQDTAGGTEKMGFMTAAGQSMFLSGGTAAVLTIGAAAAVDTAIVWDGNAVDWYAGLDDSDDSFVIGAGSTVGGLPRIRMQPTGDHYFASSLSGTYTSSGSSSVVIGWAFEPVLTAVAGDTTYQSHVLMGANGGGSITTQNNSETISLISTVFINEPDITKGNDTVTNAASVYIAGAPSEATNNYSLFVDAGASRFDGAISLGTDHGDDGQQLTSGGDDAACDWTAASSLREHKHIGKEADPNSALQAMLDSKAYHFKYKEKMGTGDSNTEYIGVMADDAPWAMHYKGKIVNPVNSLGYTVLSIQALHDRIEQLENKLQGV